MYLILLFDLPTYTKKERKTTTKFRKELLNMGFVMFQYSVYVLPFKGYYKKNYYIDKINKIAPKNGKVVIFTITEKQFQSKITIEKFASVEDKMLKSYHQNILDLDFLED